MFAVTVAFTLPPSRLSDFLALILDNAAQSLAREPGCLHFDVCTDPDRPGEVFLYEVYTDRAAFDAHLATAHFESFDKATRDMVSSKEVRTFRKVGA